VASLSGGFLFITNLILSCGEATSQAFYLIVSQFFLKLRGKDCIEGHQMLASIVFREESPASKPSNRALSCDVSREEVEDWLNDIPLFE
jgi:hypothetical protein